MSKLKLIKIQDDAIYQELLTEYRDAKPAAVESCLRFMQIGAWMHLRQESLYAQYGLTSGRFSLLMFLRCSPTRSLTPSKLAESARVTRGTMTQFIDALEKDGLVQRRTEPSDRRSLVVKLTAKGETLLRQLLPQHLSRLEGVAKILTPKESNQLHHLMEKLAEGLTLV